VCDSLDRIDDWASEIVGWIRFVLGAVAMMSFVLVTVEHWVSKAFELVLHVHLSSDAVSFSLSLKHVFKSLQVDFWGILSCLGLDTLISLFFHFLTGTIVSVGVSILDHLSHEVYDLWEVVTGVSHLVWVNVQSLEVALDVLDELNLLIHWIGVIKP